MLTVDLVRVKYQGEQVIPRYIDEEDESFLELTGNLIEFYNQHQGKSRSELKACIDDFLGQNSDILIYRGLCKLLEDRCEFDVDAHLDPVEIRRFTFELATQSHRDGNFERETILAQVGAHFKISPVQVENYLFADLKDNQIIQNFKEISASLLLKRYNTGLAQAILLKAFSLEIHIKDQNSLRYRQLFRAIKFHRLLYQITHCDGFKIVLDGPMNLFRSSQKYGLQMALFLPALLLCEDWHLKARIQWGRTKSKKSFLLDNKQNLYSNYRDTGMYQPPEIQVFLERFQKLESNWEISADCDYLELDAQEICIPDYSFSHQESGTVVFMEIFGFWRKAALQKRLETMPDSPNLKLLLAVSTKLNVEREPETAGGSIYHFHEVLNPKKVLVCLNEFL